MKEVRLTISKDGQGNPLNITDFAKKLDVKRSAISEAENYRRAPSNTVIKRIEENYNINILDGMPPQNVDEFIDTELRPLSKTDSKLANFLKKYDHSLENMRSMFPGFKEQKTIEVTTQEQNAENDLLAKEVQELREQNKKLEAERDDWREQARFLKGLLEGKK